MQKMLASFIIFYEFDFLAPISTTFVNLSFTYFSFMKFYQSI